MTTVEVRVVLAGGVERSWRCPTDDPSVKLLMDALATNAHPQAGRDRPLVRLVIPGETGERALVFLRTSLVAVEIEPPLVEVMPTVHTARASAAPAGPTVDERVERPRAAVFPDFLSPEDRDEVLRYLLEHEREFVASGVQSADESRDDDYDYRRSRVLMDFGPLRAPFLAAIRATMPHALRALDLEMPEDPRYELQVTAHNHLDYFKVHRDNTNPAVRERLVSWVWYLHRHPRPFRGGELVLFDSLVGPSGARQGSGFRLFEPADNTLIVFPSACYHLVRTIHCPTRAFADSRFTVNGWLRDPARTTARIGEGTAPVDEGAR